MRTVMDKDKLLEVNEIFEQVAKEEGFYSAELMEEVAATGTLAHIEGIPDWVKRVFVTARDVTPEWHARMQAAFQKSTDNAVSKTVNFPPEATEDEVRRLEKGGGVEPLMKAVRGRKVGPIATFDDREREEFCQLHQSFEPLARAPCRRRQDEGPLAPDQPRGNLPKRVGVAPKLDPDLLEAQAGGAGPCPVSTIAAGRAPRWRSVRIAEKATSSLPTITGRWNGRRPWR